MERKRHPSPLPDMLTIAAARDYPAAEIVVSFPDAWEVVHRFRQADTLRYVAGFPPSQEKPRSNHFFGLPPEINRSLTTYRLYKLFAPRTIPLFQIAWNSRVGEGRIIDSSGPRVHLQPVGQAQIWKGDTYGVLWECYGFETQRQRPHWQEELQTFWRAVENDMGVKKLFTHPHEPSFAEGYTEFLSGLGYAPDPDFERWWSKER